ncbi:LOB domain-containing protein [Quillaja saponaria]|uniref:LOB domain-containing protein n=1 Tax=Quillaja saponaria TaxID=32244 RepID=A0AAD7KT01_QUISA|nr:LOB domain-containing protein [Quillaja saponaria]KAJ7944395.1 LOB domain-containing protein [Quillaja saponaria]
MSSSNSPCAACKFLRRKCTQECVFAPYFPPDNPKRFADVHKVFGASNVAKLLNELNASQRDDAVKSLAYEAEHRLRDPVYGCVGLISILQHKLKQMQIELTNAKKELATYIGPQAMLPIIQPPGLMQQPQHNPGNPSSSVFPYNNMPPPMMGIPTGGGGLHGGQLLIRDPQQQHQQIFEAQQLAAAVAAREQQEFFRTYEQQHHHQQEVLRFNNSGFEVGSVSGGGFSQMSASAAAGISPSLALGTFDNPYQMQPQAAEHHPHHHQLQAQLFLTPQQHQPQQQSQLSQQKSESEEGRSVGPSC